VSARSQRWAVPLAGLVLGLVLGLVYSWAIDPVQLINTYPGVLRADYRHDWVQLVAMSYVADGDLNRAQARLASLDQDDVAAALRTLIEEEAAAGQSSDVMRDLSTLALSLNVHTPAMFIYEPPSPPAATGQPTPTPTRPTETPLPSPTATRTAPPPSPTRKPTRPPASATTSPSSTSTVSATLTRPPPTVTPTPVLTFQLSDQEMICKPARPLRIEVLVEDEKKQPMDGIVVWLIWDTGADRAVTGLKPVLGSGYVDFSVRPDATYGLRVGELGPLLVTQLGFTNCPVQDGNSPTLGSWRVTLHLAPIPDE